MSIILSDLSFHYPNQQVLFDHLNFSVGKQEKVSLVGPNGAGKSTLLKLMAGLLQPATGSVISSSGPYYISQHTGSLDKNIAELLGVDRKLAALHAIENGSISPIDFDVLADDWEVESRCEAALSYWNLPDIKLDMPADNLSGGEKTKILLAGLLVHAPEIVLLDEPTNHLDQTSRELLYKYINQSKASIVVVSHDTTLLDQLQITYELSEFGIRSYGGNYSFYKAQKETAQNALDESIHEQEKMLRLARKQAQEVKQRQEKRTSQGKKNKMQGGGARILLNALGNSAENTASRLKNKQVEIVSEGQNKLAALRKQKEQLKEIKIDFDQASLHTGKLLIEASGVNFEYQQGKMLWEKSIDFTLYSDDRIHLLGDNGAGKTTFIRLLTGDLEPSAGWVKRTAFHWIYLDQDYSQVDLDCSIEQLAGKYSRNELEEHEVKLRLNRFLFPADSWNKNCKNLSGGEKMRLALCCLMLSNQTPDLIILDEPTNNLDVISLQILTQTIRGYKGSLLIVSHDKRFVEEIGTTQSLTMERIR